MFHAYYMNAQTAAAEAAPFVAAARAEGEEEVSPRYLPPMCGRSSMRRSAFYPGMARSPPAAAAAASVVDCKANSDIFSLKTL